MDISPKQKVAQGQIGCRKTKTIRPLVLERDDAIRLSAIVIARASIQFHSYLGSRGKTVGQIRLTFQHRDPDFLAWIGRTLDLPRFRMHRATNRRVFRCTITGRVAASILLTILPHATHKQELFRVLIAAQQASINQDFDQLHILGSQARDSINPPLADQLLRFQAIRDAG